MRRTTTSVPFFGTPFSSSVTVIRAGSPQAYTADGRSAVTRKPICAAVTASGSTGLAGLGFPTASRNLPAGTETVAVPVKSSFGLKVAA